MRYLRKGGNYQADDDAAKDAVVDLQERMRQVQGKKEMTTEDKESIEVTLKSQVKSRS